MTFNFLDYYSHESQNLLEVNGAVVIEGLNLFIGEGVVVDFDFVDEAVEILWRPARCQLFE